jgi:hypothetical protein
MGGKIWEFLTWKNLEKAGGCGLQKKVQPVRGYTELSVASAGPYGESENL